MSYQPPIGGGALGGAFVGGGTGGGPWPPGYDQNGNKIGVDSLIQPQLPGPSNPFIDIGGIVGQGGGGGNWSGSFAREYYNGNPVAGQTGGIPVVGATGIGGGLPPIGGVIGGFGGNVGGIAPAPIIPGFEQIQDNTSMTQDGFTRVYNATNYTPYIIGAVVIAVAAVALLSLAKKRHRRR